MKLDKEKIYSLKGLTTGFKGGIESRMIVDADYLTMTLFAFDKGQDISEYVVPGEQMIYVYLGVVVVTIDNKDFSISEGETILVPKDSLYSVYTKVESKLLTINIK